MTSQDDTVSVGLFGPFAVGKTAISVQYVSNKFLTEHDPTLEDFFEVKKKICGETVNLTIYDTAGQESYQALVPQYMRNAEGILLVYSVTDRESFEKIQELHKKLIQAKEVPDLSSVPIVLLGNKKDLEDERKVSTEEGKKFAESLKCKFLETSAKTRENIDQAFDMVVAEAFRLRKKKGTSPAKGKGGGCNTM